MKHSKLKHIITLTTIMTSFSVLNPSVTYAAQWILNEQGQSYKTSNGTAKSWQYIDGRQYHVSNVYYLLM